MANIKLQLDTHHYDGVIGQLYHQLIHDDVNEKFMTFEQSIELIEKWMCLSHIKNKGHIVNAVNLLKNDRNRNYDRANDIHVEELLPRVMNIIKNFDSCGIDLFLQNLGEISELGSCPQGRTTRLLSFYIPYKT